MSKTKHWVSLNDMNTGLLAASQKRNFTVIGPGGKQQSRRHESINTSISFSKIMTLHFQLFGVTEKNLTFQLSNTGQ